MSLCTSIDTLSMAYLDDELASEERRELELHLVECADCKGHLDGERAELDFLRTALVAPPAPDLLKAKIARSLDAEDKVIATKGRKQWQRFMLPGSAMLAAAAALLVFVTSVKGPTEQRASSVAHEAARQERRPLPLEVQGASTGPWLRQHFAPVEPPQFRDSANIELIGARATAIAGHDAALLRYLVNVGVNRVSLTAVLISNLRREELPDGEIVQAGKMKLHVYDANGQPAVTYIDERGIGYVFTSERMTAQELISLVGTSDLIPRAQEQLR